MSTYPADVHQFLQPILAQGYAVWLVGSRANQKARNDSDWDFIIFGNECLISELKQRQNPGNIDALIVFDGDNFRCPWPRPSDGVIKSGNLSRWQWKLTSVDYAEYVGSKESDAWGTVRREMAIRVSNMTEQSGQTPIKSNSTLFSGFKASSNPINTSASSSYYCSIFALNR